MNKKSHIVNQRNVPPLPNSHYETIVELISDREAVIEGCRGIIEYNDTVVTVNCKNYLMSFRGLNLCIRALNDESLGISGRITDIAFSYL